jgi:hypothetical protein
MNLLEQTLALCADQPFRVLNISRGGLSIIYVHETGWPDPLNINLRFPRKDLIIRDIECVTVWEAGMNLSQLRKTSFFRRRGLQFVEPGAKPVHLLLNLVEYWNRGRASSLPGKNSEPVAFYDLRLKDT